MGLRGWLRDDETPDAEAAGGILADVILMWRRVLETKFKKSE